MDAFGVTNLQVWKPSYPDRDLDDPPKGWFVSDIGQKTVLWTREGSSIDVGDVVTSSPGLGVETVSNGPDQLTLRVTNRTAAPGRIILSRLAWPGYSVNGPARAVDPTADMLLTVEVPGGSDPSEVDIRFEPPGLRLGLWLLSLGTLFVLILELVRRRSPESVAPRVDTDRPTRLRSWTPCTHARSVATWAISTAHGVVAPWICDLLEQDPPAVHRLRECDTCGLTYFTRRYTGPELDLLYRGYRGRITSEDAGVGNRGTQRASMMRTHRDPLRPGLGSSTWRTLCESTVPGGIGRSCSTWVATRANSSRAWDAKRKLLLDPSHRELPPGVERVNALDALPDDPDLVILAHVLEHLPDPLSQLQDIRKIMQPEAVLYVELPWDRPETSGVHRRPSFARGSRWLVRHRLAYVPTDFVSGALRQLGVSRVPLPTVKQSEHINYFTPSALDSLLRRAGFEVVGQESDRAAKMAGMRMGLIATLARPIV